MKFFEYNINCNNFYQMKMDSDIKEKIYCDDYGEYITFSFICDKLAIDSYYNNHKKSQTHIINFRGRQQLTITNKSTLQFN